MSASTDLLDGMIGDAVAAGLGVYRPNGPAYTAAETAIGVSTDDDTPDRWVVFTLYMAPNDEPEQAITTYAVQVRTRAGPDPYDEIQLRDSVFDLFHGVTHRQYGSVHADQILRNSLIVLGRDTVTGLFESTQNFYIDCDMPPTANRPY